MSRTDVVGDSIDPSSETAALVERNQAPPNGDVDLLKQIASAVDISLVGPRQAGQGRTVGINCDLVQLVVFSHRAVDGVPYMR